MTNTICAEYSTRTTDQPPVGPCVLRPGHRGHIHQDVRGIQWATRPATCPTSPTGKHWYSEGDGRPESRICDHCGAGGCCAPSVPVEYCGDLSPSVFGEAPAECVLRPGHSARHSDNRGRRWWHTPDEDVTDSDPVGELRARLAAALRVMLRSEQEIADLRAELRARDKVIAQQRATAQRALCDVAAVARVRGLADRWYGQGAPATSYARELLATLDNAA
ncbi:hypothetical protein ACFC34_00430 [Streptomyces sp. NPDC056053]|uniref:hypothetical protein n=1 Tax=Streptomyces sp. NPDC056053 TaxID=3345696 RepID=UPI0035DE4B50